MFRDFYFSNFFPYLPQNSTISPSFPFIQPCLNNEMVYKNIFNNQHQTYTTKFIAVKQEQILVKNEHGPQIVVKQQVENQEITQKKQNKSIFHNYQKHLVTTLKQKITLEQLHTFDPNDECLSHLWQGFNKVKIANRSLLLAVFGEQKSNDVDIIKLLEKCRLQGIVHKFSIEEIKEAQKKIRRIVSEHFREKDLDAELEGRKLPQQEKNIFKQYVGFFLSELAEGTLNRRLPKRYKRQMIL